MADMPVYRASCFAPVNIAVVKYWGKRDTELNLPTNSSISVTLSHHDLRAHTTAMCSDSFTADELFLNGDKEDVTAARTRACLKQLRSMREEMERSDESLRHMSNMKLKVVSANNFPTAAGLASSAAGFGALVRAVANLYNLPATPTQLSAIARQGSGSACRSLFGGYVAWEMGSSPDGSDSVAAQVAPVSHWPEMRAIILVASSQRKQLSSTAGMQATVATSELMQMRIKHVVPERMQHMTKAILDNDFASFARLTMKDSNSFHATCLDTEPPIFYMNDASRAAVRMVDAINDCNKSPVAAYTFDAGPNAVIYYLEQNAAKVVGVLKSVLSSKKGWETDQGRAVVTAAVPENARVAAQILNESIDFVILTSVDEGPVATAEHLSI